MPKRYEVGGKIYEVPDDATLADVAKSAARQPLAVNVSEQMGARLAGGYEMTDAPEGLVSRTLRGMVKPSPEQQLAMDVLPLAAGTPILSRLRPSLPTRLPLKSSLGSMTTPKVAEGLTTAVGAVAGYKVGGWPGLIIARELARPFAERVRTVLEARQTARTPPAETIQGVSVDALRAAGVGDRAIQATLRNQAAARAPSPTPTPQPGVIVKPVPSGASIDPVSDVRATIRTAQEQPPTAAPEPLKPVKMSTAVEDIRTAARSEKILLNAEERSAAQLLRQQGYDQQEIVRAILVKRLEDLNPSFANLPRSTEVPQRRSYKVEPVP